MKAIVMFFIRSYFRMLSAIWPAHAGARAFKLFQHTRKLPFKKAELEFYARARKFEVVHPKENVQAYELGDAKGSLVILVHGWESNAGSMSAIANALAFEGHRVVALDLPAHGHSVLTHTNLRECREALCALIYHLRPSKPFSIISHSFGSAVATMALTGTRYSIDKFIMLTSPNRLLDVFDEFKKQIALGEEAYQEMLQITFSLLKEPVENVTVEAKAINILYKKLVLMHDPSDKVLPIANAVRLSQVLPNAELVMLPKTGHYRMLWSAEVIRNVMNEINDKQTATTCLDAYITELVTA
jgi:pimeloyl-ACP methyl ester carboxylesterase